MLISGVLSASGAYKKAVQMLHEFCFKKFETAIEAMALHIATLLQRQVIDAGQAVLAVGGGRTPRSVLPLLATQDCSWQNITVTLTDDRQVPVDDPASNERLVRKYLLRGRAQESIFHGLIGRSEDHELQLDVVYLGFGEDGHVASLFPGGPELAVAHQGIIKTFAPVPPRQRISLTLPKICSAQHLILLVSNVEKYRIYQRARKAFEAKDLPLARVLRNTRKPVSIFIVEG